MAYYLNLFSPDTYASFTASDNTITGFRPRHRNAAERVKIGDKFLLYLTGLSRWCGVATAAGRVFVDDTPRFTSAPDPYTLRFSIDDVTWLSLDRSVPIHHPPVWQVLSFTANHDPRSNRWTGKLRTSLPPIDEGDGSFLERLILAQSTGEQLFPLDEKEQRRAQVHHVRSSDGEISVSIPDNEDEEPPEAQIGLGHVRESIRVQAQLARIGAEMGMQVWLPRNDRAAVLREWPQGMEHMLTRLPLSYDDVTIQTIEQIDILWLKGRSIVRAFEVEHTTAIYSGLLRMADLLALQPNLRIRLHIVAPLERREKVRHEVMRPVFSLLEAGRLSDICTYLSYESVAELSNQHSCPTSPKASSRNKRKSSHKFFRLGPDFGEWLPATTTAPRHRREQQWPPPVAAPPPPSQGEGWSPERPG